MPEPGYVPEVVIWTNRPRLALAQHVIERLAGRVKLIAVGGPREAGLNRFAEARSLPYLDDPRRLIIEHPAAFTFVTTPEPLPAPVVGAALSQGSILLTIEPLAADLRELRAFADREATFANVVNVPDLVAMPGWMSAADPMTVLETPLSLAWQAFFAAGDCSLFSRLYEAWRFVGRECRMPEAIDASLAGTSMQPQTDLRAITGNLTVHGRWSDAAGILIQLSDGDSSNDGTPRAGTGITPSPDDPAVTPCDRYLHITGPGGRLRVTNGDYQLLNPAGGLIDRAAPGALPPGFGELIVTAFEALLRRPPQADARAIHHAATALACCQATLLSARTGQPEDPAQVLHVGGWS